MGNVAGKIVGGRVVKVYVIKPVWSGGVGKKDRKDKKAASVVSAEQVGGVGKGRRIT